MALIISQFFFAKLYFSFWSSLGNIYLFLRRFETTLSTNVGRNLQVYIAITRRYISSLSDVKFSKVLDKSGIKYSMREQNWPLLPIKKGSISLTHTVIVNISVILLIF